MAQVPKLRTGRIRELCLVACAFPLRQVIRSLRIGATDAFDSWIPGALSLLRLVSAYPYLQRGTAKLLQNSAADLAIHALQSLNHSAADHLLRRADLG
jgi:hypothetical protein